MGDGRGTLTLKKGRAMAKLMKGAEVGVGDVLGDVSEAYGAEGSAPAGFTVSAAKYTRVAAADQRRLNEDDASRCTYTSSYHTRSYL